MFLCNLLIISYKDTKNISFPQLFQSFSYTELTLKRRKNYNNTQNQKIIVQEDIASQSERSEKTVHRKGNYRQMRFNETAMEKGLTNLRRLFPNRTLTTYGKYKRNADTISKERECSRNDATSLTEELIAKCDSDGEEKVFGDFEGLKGQADRHQLAKTAKIIVTEFYYLKTDELLLFFYRFSAGRYGQFYSYFTPSVIIRGLRDFLKERARAFEQY